MSNKHVTHCEVCGTETTNGRFCGGGMCERRKPPLTFTDGRPPLPVGLIINLTEREMRELQQAADGIGTNLEAFVRIEALKAARYRNTH